MARILNTRSIRVIEVYLAYIKFGLHGFLGTDLFEDEGYRSNEKTNAEDADRLFYKLPRPKGHKSFI